MALEIVGGSAAPEMRAKHTTAAIGAEEFLRMRQRAEEILGLSDLLLRRVGIVRTLTEWSRVRIGVIADPMAFLMRALCESLTRGIGEVLAEDEEGRAQIVAAEDVEHVLGHASGWPIIEREGDIADHGALP